MRNAFFKGTGMLLSIVLIVGVLLTACSKSGTDTKTSATGSGGANSSAPKTENVKITFWEQGWDGPKDDKILPLINQKTGVNFAYEPWVVSSEEERQNKLSLLSASGEMPDVYYGSTDDWTRSLFNKMGEQGKLWDLTPFFKKYPNVQKAVQNSVPFFRDAKDNKTYIYPTQMSFQTNFPLGYNIRQDWLKQVGMSYPKSIDEFYQLLKAFKEKIKPTSGQPVIPLAFTPGLNAREFWWVVPWFGDDAATWSKDKDGNYTLKQYTDIPHLQDMVAFFNKLYREGLLDQEAFVIKDVQLKEKISQDRVGVQLLNDYETSSIIDTLNQGAAKDAMYVMSPWFFEPGVDGTYNGKRKLGPGAPSGVYVSKNLSESQVNALFKGLDWMLSKEGQLLVNFGIEGTHWNYNADKKIEKTPDFVKRAQNDWNKEAHEGVGYYQQLALYPPAYLDLLPDSVRYPRTNSKPNEQNQQSIWSDKPSEDLDPMMYVNPGPVEQKSIAPIDTAWKDIVIKAIMAKSENEARATVAKWTDTLMKMGWDAIVKERTESAKNVNLKW
jgi:putative aldouronate transport system substrate-binding protein